MGLTTDRDDPRLGHGVDEEPISQHEVYLVLSEEERAKGFVRPLRHSYKHVGTRGPRFPLRDLDDEEKERYGDIYVRFEQYPEDVEGIGRFWKHEQLNNIEKGCGVVTTMNPQIAETYAREPFFYGATYCCKCMKHLPVGKDGEFVWVEDLSGRVTDQLVGQ